MNFREMTQSDLDYVKDNSLSRGILNKQPDVIDFAYTLEDGGRVLGIGGIRLINMTTAWAWVDLTEIVPAGFFAMQDKLDSLCKEHNIKRLQAYVECDFPKAIRTIEYLGFERESVMKNFVDDRDAFLYVRFA